MPVASKVRSESEYHQSFWAEAHPKEGRRSSLPKPSTTPTRKWKCWRPWSSNARPGKSRAARAAGTAAASQSPYGGYRTPQTRTHQHHNRRPEPHYSPIDHDLAGHSLRAQEGLRATHLHYGRCDTLSAAISYRSTAAVVLGDDDGGRARTLCPRRSLHWRATGWCTWWVAMSAILCLRRGAGC